MDDQITRRPMSSEQLAACRATPLGPMPNRVRLARTLLGLEQGVVAEGAGLTRAALSAIERGDYKSVQVDNARKLAEFFGVLIEDLFPAREAVAS